MINPLNGGYVNFRFGVLLQSTVALDYGFQLDLYGLNHGWLSSCLTWYRDKVEAALPVQSNHSSFGGPALVDEVFSPETVIMGG